MCQALTLFISTFSTLLAIINPLEALPVFLKLLEGKDANQHWQVARRSCLYAMLLLFFFFVFGALILRVFGVSLSMVRIVGGIILMRIGFDLFSGSSSGGSMIAFNGSAQKGDIAFVPLAMPLMCGPGAIATMLGMTSLVKRSEFELVSFLAIAAAILATMFVTYLCLAYASFAQRQTRWRPREQRLLQSFKFWSWALLRRRQV
jgi:MarC family membrane protein